MKPFTLEPRMLTMGGIFYPTGHVFAMFPNQDDACKVEAALQREGFDTDEIMLLEPETILNDIGFTVKETDKPLPSAGSEVDTVRHYTELARQGHCALLIPARSDKATERLLEVIHTVPFSVAEKYNFLTMEQLH